MTLDVTSSMVLKKLNRYKIITYNFSHFGIHIASIDNQGDNNENFNDRPRLRPGRLDAVLGIHVPFFSSPVTKSPRNIVKADYMSACGDDSGIFCVVSAIYLKTHF